MSDTSNNGGIGFAGLLTLIFITLKLTHVIAWSWLWVLSPLWIGLAIGIVFLLIAFVLAGVFTLAGLVGLLAAVRS